ncbi:MAG: hypothetical protein ACLFQX_09080 [Candidatus Kapaibacterium sp.]
MPSDKFEQFQIFLPAYLTDGSKYQLYHCLNSYPENLSDLNNNFYLPKNKFSNEYLQGDICFGFHFLSLPDINLKTIEGLIISNTCDISRDNKRSFSKIDALYAPVQNIEKYRSHLLQHFPENKIEAHLGAIRKQEITNIFYLPENPGLFPESFVYLDKIFNCKISYLNPGNVQKQLSLGNYGFYILLFKLSIHFSRFGEGIDRR